MKNQPKHKKPLSLDKQTVKQLAGHQLKAVVGGSCLEVKPPEI